MGKGGEGADPVSAVQPTALSTFPLAAAQRGNLCSFRGRGRALSPGQDEGGDNQGLMLQPLQIHREGLIPTPLTQDHEAGAGSCSCCQQRSLGSPRGEELAEQLCCDCLQQGHGQSHTWEGGTPNDPKTSTGGSKTMHSHPALVLAGLEGARSRAGHQRARVPRGQDEAVPTTLGITRILNGSCRDIGVWVTFARSFLS